MFYILSLSLSTSRGSESRHPGRPWEEGTRREGGVCAFAVAPPSLFIVGFTTVCVEMAITTDLTLCNCCAATADLTSKKFRGVTDSYY